VPHWSSSDDTPQSKMSQQDVAILKLCGKSFALLINGSRTCSRGLIGHLSEMKH